MKALQIMELLVHVAVRYDCLKNLIHREYIFNLVHPDVSQVIFHHYFIQRQIFRTFLHVKFHMNNLYSTCTCIKTADSNRSIQLILSIIYMHEFFFASLVYDIACILDISNYMNKTLWNMKETIDIVLEILNCQAAFTCTNGSQLEASSTVLPKCYHNVSRDTCTTVILPKLC